MNKRKLNIKLRKQICVCLAIITISMLFAFACCLIPVRRANADVSPNFSAQINVKTSDGGYLFGNGDAYLFADTLQSVIDSITEKADGNSSISIYFENVSTDESLSFADKTYYLSGELVSTKTHFNAPFINIVSGTLQMNGLVLRSLTSAVNVCENALFVLYGSQILVNAESRNYSAYALNVNGKAEIIEGRIELESKYTSGSALSGSNPSSVIIVGSLGSNKNIFISGNSACVFNSGTVEINDGIFEATHPTYSTAEEEGSTLSGYAVLLSSDSVVKINGGKFSSVTPTNTISLSGNRNSRLCFNGGEVYGQITISPLNDSSFFEIGGSCVSSTDGVGISVKSSDEVLTPKNAVLTIYNENGYKFVCWFTPNGAVYDKEISYSSLPLGETQVISTNVYTVTFQLADKNVVAEFAYGEKVRITDYISEFPEGFEIENWLKDGVPLNEENFIVTGENLITANLKLNKPVLQKADDVSKVYDGLDFTVSVLATHEIANLSFVWEKLDLSTQEFAVFSNEEDLTLCDVSDSGAYRCMVRAEYNGYVSEDFSNIIKIEIGKANYTEVPFVELEGIYGKNKTLANYELPSGFEWEDENIIPCVNITEYTATYCLDKENYYEKNALIKLKLNKGQVIDDYTVYPHSGLQGVYSPNQTLSDFALDEFYYWSNPDFVPICTRYYYDIYFNPDKDNYENFDTMVVLNLEKATYTDIEDLYFEQPYKDGLTLFDFNDKLPEGYSFANRYPVLIELTVGVSRYNLIYNTDKENYQDYDKAVAVVSIIKGTPDFEGRSPFYGTYAPKTTLADFTFGEYEYLRWSNDASEVLLGENEYDAIYNPDNELFNDLNVKITIVLEKGISSDINYEYTVDVAYSENLTLGDLELESGYRFVNSNVKIMVGANQRFEAVYNPNPDFYVDGNLFITVNVAKGIISFESFVFADLTTIYDGNKHFIEYSGKLPDAVDFVEYLNNGQTNAGVYEVKCVLVQIDTENYELADLDYSAVLTIEKAVSEIEGESEQIFIYDGERKNAVVSLNNKQQILTSNITNKFVKTGVYKIVFKAEESENYLSSELTVTVIIKKDSVSSSKDGITVSIVDGLHGFEENEALTLNVLNSEENCLRISLDFECNSTESRKIIIHSTSSKYDFSKLTSIVDSKGNKLSYEFVKDTNDLVIDGDNLGELELTFKVEKYTYAVEITLGVISLTLLIAIITFFIVSKRRKNNEKK